MSIYLEREKEPKILHHRHVTLSMPRIELCSPFHPSQLCVSDPCLSPLRDESDVLNLNVRLEKYVK